MNASPGPSAPVKSDGRSPCEMTIAAPASATAMPSQRQPVMRSP